MSTPPILLFDALSAVVTAADPLAVNQMVRWVNAKDAHADKIISQISDYGLCQRVKPFGSKGSPFESAQDCFSEAGVFLFFSSFIHR